MTELNEVIEEGGLHSTGKCNQSYGEDAGFIATKGTRAQGEEKRSWNPEMAGGRSGGFILSGLELFKVVESFVEVAR